MIDAPVSAWLWMLARGAHGRWNWLCALTGWVCRWVEGRRLRLEGSTGLDLAWFVAEGNYTFRDLSAGFKRALHTRYPDANVISTVSN